MTFGILIFDLNDNLPGMGVKVFYDAKRLKI
jgi:hypothetical protein